MHLICTLPIIQRKIFDSLTVLRAAVYVCVCVRLDVFFSVCVFANIILGVSCSMFITVMAVFVSF